MANDPFDPYNPLTSAGQTAFGGLIRGQNELFDRQRQQVEDSAALVRKLRGEDARTAYHPLEAEPRRKLSLEQEKRCAVIRARITARPGFFDRLAGRVVSYLTEQGDLRADADGDLALGEVVKHQEHLRRLALAYRRYYEFGLQSNEAKKSGDERASLSCLDAKERLEFLARGRFISPLSKNDRLICDMVRMKKTFFGRKQVPTEYTKVPIHKYDQQFRFFCRRIYEGYEFGSAPAIANVPLVYLPMQRTFEYFLRSPCRGRLCWRLPPARPVHTAASETTSPT